MSLEIQNLIANLDSITSVDDPDELQSLEDSVNQLLASKNPELGIDALLRVFEKFPNKDGFGIFWSILHGLESLPNYQEKLVESVNRQPSYFGVMMINRMLNSSHREVKSMELLSVLKKVVADERLEEEIRREAQNFIEWQQSRK